MTIKVETEELKDDFIQLSPSATHAIRDVGFKNIDHPSVLQAAMNGMQKFSIRSPQ